MNDLDLNQPAPHLEGISAEAQALIEQLWALVAAQAKRIEQLPRRGELSHQFEAAVQ